LPEGFKRVAYDSDTGRYYFRDPDGQLWEGPRGADFGEMKRGEHNLILPLSPLSYHTPLSQCRSPRSHYSIQMLRTLKPARLTSVIYPTLISLRTNFACLQPPPQYTPTSPYRTLFPFFLIIATVLLLLWRLLLSPSYIPPAPASPCPSGTDDYLVKAGDTCWRLSQARGSSVERLRQLNEGLDCNSLQIGERICLPVERTHARRH
jgi:hypothetical protein